MDLFCIICLYWVLGLFTETTPQINQRIIGGYITTVKRYPFIVSLHYLEEDFKCGASIINKKFALTAAHCTIGRVPSNIFLRAGSSYVHKGGIIHKIKSIYPYPGFEFPHDDIALLKVTEEFRFNKRIKFIKINPYLEVPGGRRAKALGWGYLNDFKDLPYQLMWVEQEIWPHQECKEFYENSEDYVNITDQMICSGCRNKRRGTCQGDSGGPLISKGRLIGIVSGGNSYTCDLFNEPGFYTKVAAYKGWIYSIVNQI